MTSMRIDKDKSAKVWGDRFRKLAQEALDDGVQFFWCDTDVYIEKGDQSVTILEEEG